MPHTASAKKRLRQTIKRTARNRARKSRVRTYIRKLEDAVASGDKAAAEAALRAAEPEIAKGAQNGIMHRNTAARTVSRLARKVNTMV